MAVLHVALRLITWVGMACLAVTGAILVGFGSETETGAGALLGLGWDIRWATTSA